MHTLYRMYDYTDTLLYVGITMNPPGRFAKHTIRSWWGCVERIEMTRYDSRADALDAETLAIYDECPIFNLSRPHFNTRPGEFAQFVACSVCGRELVDLRSVGDEPATRCTPCDEAVCDAHAAGAQWGMQFIEGSV